MNIKKKLVAAGVAFGLAAGVLAVAAPANAESTSSGYSAVGSDTLQDVMNALTNGSTLSGSQVRVTAGGTQVGSFDAFPAGVIQTKPFGPYFPRPGGSGAGVSALIASINNTAYSGSALTIGGQVDIARSSSAAGSNADANGDLVYVPFGRDALGYTYIVDPAWPQADKDAFANLTQAQLAAIYNGTQTTIAGHAVHPRLPQINSGTRQTFLTKLGFASNATPASVPAADNTAAGPAENDARVLTVPGEIIGFSVANWISQFNGASSVNTTTAANVAFGNADAIAPFTLASGKLAPNQAYYSSAWGRDTFLVTEYAKVTPVLPGTSTPNPRYDAKLAALLNPSGAGQTSLVTSGSAPTTPGGLKRVYGFLAPSSATPVRSHPNVYPDSVWPGN